MLLLLLPKPAMALRGRCFPSVTHQPLLSVSPLYHKITAPLETEWVGIYHTLSSLYNSCRSEKRRRFLSFHRQQSLSSWYMQRLLLMTTDRLLVYLHLSIINCAPKAASLLGHAEFLITWTSSDSDLESVPLQQNCSKNRAALSRAWTLEECGERKHTRESRAVA